MARNSIADSSWVSPLECNVDGIKLPPGVDRVVDDLKTWEVRGDDVWIVTYPKAGNSGD